MILQSFSEPMHLREIRPAQARGTVLYLHGLGESCLSFEDLLRSQPLKAYRQLAPDLPGCGKSPWPDSRQGLEDLADAVGRWLEQVNESVVVVGHSMGGVLGLLLCERFPHLVRGLINVEGNVSEADCSFSRRIASFSPEAFEAEGYGEVLQEVYEAGLEDSPLRTYFASLSLADPRTLHRCATELFAVSQREELALRLAALRVPQIYVLGDPRGTGAYSRSLLDEVGLPWHAIDDAGHWVFLDQPEPFLEFFVGQLDEMFP